LHTDIPRLRQGGLKAQFWSVYVPASTERTGNALLQTMEQIDLVHEMVAKYPDVFEMVKTADDIERITNQGKIASMIGVEGGYSIQESLPVLRHLYERGTRYMTLTHSKTLSWADSATDKPLHGGLTPFGEEVVREMNRLGMLVDISHVSPDTMVDALRVSKAPVIFSHSSARAIADHPRNVPDDVLRLMPANGGVVMINFFSCFVVPTDQLKADRNRLGTVKTVVDHIEHVIQVAGIDQVCLGSDFDGIPRVPRQLDDVAHYPYITQELLNRGYTRDQIAKVLGGNALRALRQAEEVAQKLRSGEIQFDPQ
jgi:membrane dipeptidase